MAPPPPMPCSAAGCEFKTPDGIPTYDQCLQSLSLHISSAHPQQPAAAPSTAKPDKLRRPSISEGITEADWVWFEDRWNMYKESTGLEGRNAVIQLWDCANKELARRCYEAGNNDGITEDELLTSLNGLEVAILHCSLLLLLTPGWKQFFN